MTHHTDHQSTHDFTPLPDEVYDVIAALHEKSMGLAAYEQYLADAQDEQSNQGNQ